jgi:hypothetical protein
MWKMTALQDRVMAQLLVYAMDRRLDISNNIIDEAFEFDRFCSDPGRDPHTMRVLFEEEVTRAHMEWRTGARQSPYVGGSFRSGFVHLLSFLDANRRFAMSPDLITNRFSTIDDETGKLRWKRFMLSERYDDVSKLEGIGTN